MQTLKQLLKEINKCVHCGTCRSVCPTFGVIGREAASARGKVSLCDALLKKEIGLSETFVKHITECVLCGACRESCPNDVPVPDIVLAARAEAVKEEGLSLAQSFVTRNLLNSDRFMSQALKAASKLQTVLFKGVPEESGLHRRFPLPFVDEHRLVPKLAEKFFLENIGQRLAHEYCSWEVRETTRSAQRGHSSKPRVGFFVGCVINYIYPHIGEASLEALKKAGASVVIPLEQRCCGMPALGMGDVETAKSLVLKNLEAFEQYELDFIVTACATCGEGLKKRWKELLADEGPDVQRRIEKISDKVRDITELLSLELGFKGSKGHGFRQSKFHGSNPLVTYHDPCHLSRGQGIKDAPREIIEISGLRFKEMSHPCKCCGLGGSFAVTNYNFSMEITRSKAEDIQNTGADIVATACPGCMIQLKDGLHHIGAKKRVVHVVELLISRDDQE